MTRKVVITGAFGYSGSFITELLLEKGYEVKTLTNSLNRKNPFEGNVHAVAFNFDQPEQLTEDLKGAEALINTYWVRFNHDQFNHSQAVKNTFTLFDAAKKAGVKRIVHTSITNPSLESELEYFHGKAEIELKLKNLGVPYSILRPAVLFGGQDILINNIAWTLRKFPVVCVFGKGDYKLQPIHVRDFAELAVSQITAEKNSIIDAIGPETYAYRDLVKTIGQILGKNRPILSVPVWLGYWSCWLLGKVVGDVVITRQEIKGLMDGLLCTESKPAGPTKLSEWAKTHAGQLGQHYASELQRRRDTHHSYAEIDKAV